NELFLGPLSSALLLLLVISLTLLTRGFSKIEINDFTMPFLSFAVVAFVYSLSLAYFTRIFLSGLTASVIHVILRNLFSISALNLFRSIACTRRYPVVGAVAGLLLTAFLTAANPTNLQTIYGYMYCTFPFFTLLMSVELYRTKQF